MNERKMERTLLELFEDIASDEELQASLDHPALANAQVKTFEDAGLLTRDRGIVLSLEEGSEFQITIVQSARSEDEDSDEDEEAN
jgi:hypothetical protein